MDITEAGARLAENHAQTGQRFLRLADRMAMTFGQSEVEPWAETCVVLAEGGWHCYEATQAYLALSETFLASNNPLENLLASGEFGQRLCEYSFDPGKTYFETATLLLSRHLNDAFVMMDETGRALQGRYPHASSMVTDYFRKVQLIAPDTALGELREWLGCIRTLLNVERATLARFIELSNAQQQAWTFVANLLEAGTSECLSYLDSYGDLSSACPREFLLDLQPTIERYVQGPHPVSDWYAALVNRRPTGREGQLLIGLFDLIEDVRLATGLLTVLDVLPMDRPRLLNDWVRAGLVAYETGFDAGDAFFRLQSSSSQEVLSALRGQIHFDDCKRVLQLYTEAFCGRQIEIVSTLPGEEGYRELPGTDGKAIHLPDTSGYFETQDENFEFYKVALLHQLGYFEFGTFDSIRESNRLVQSFDYSALARRVFNVLEDARVDWQLAHRFRGAALSLKDQKRQALNSRTAVASHRWVELLEALIRCSLDETDYSWVSPSHREDAHVLAEMARGLATPGASIGDTRDVLTLCMPLIEDWTGSRRLIDDELYPVPVVYRGEMDPDQVLINLALAEFTETLEIEIDEEEEMLSISSVVDPENAKIVEIRKGDVSEDQGLSMSDLDIDLDDLDMSEEDAKDEISSRFREIVNGIARQGREDQRFRYDEWDYLISDYRRRWCTLHEIRTFDEDRSFFDTTLREQRPLIRKVRKQLNMLKPELLRKIKGVTDGDELDLERAVESVVDRKSGFTPEERIYIQRQRKDRDVAALFLLDMSASTDDVIVSPKEPDTPPGAVESDDYLTGFTDPTDPSSEQEKRIIDLEKESVVLMIEALEELGDTYSVCGFSGYGREQVDYFLCKDFDEALDYRSKGRIGGIRPCRSTRMGPAIRHATRSLVRTECRIKALIIISDGYPQDHDYGADRNSREYGIMDTMKALTESRQQGVSSFCLTVDPSGHDYLRAMCPDSQYMVIQDIRQLPNELSKVYRSLTG